MRRTSATIFALALALGALAVPVRDPAVAQPSPGASDTDAAPSPCPRVLRLESRDGLTYAAVFDAPEKTVAKVDLTLYTGRSDQTASLASVDIATPYASRDGEPRFRSTAILLKNARGDALIAATIRTAIPGSSDVCPAENRDIPPVAQVVSRRRGSGSGAQLNLAIASEIAQARDAVPLLPLSTVTAFPCATPFARARTLERAHLVYPATHDSGMVLVKVELDAASRISSASVDRSSGNSLLDGAAVEAAEGTTYATAFDRCVPVPSTYIFHAEFTYGHRRR